MDLSRAVPYFALEESKRDDIWDDGLHLYVADLFLNSKTNPA